jgi:putative endonuclease
MYWIYILENLNDKSWYIGYTSDLERRIKEHQEGSGARTTRIKKDWHLIYCEGYLEKLDAMGREQFLKSGSGRKFVKKQLTNYLDKAIR